MMIRIGMIYNIYKDVKVEAAASTASHQLKHGRLEDGYNKVRTVLMLLLLFESILNFIPSLLTYLLTYLLKAMTSYC